MLFDETFLDIADSIWFVLIEGWKESIGMRNEFEKALELGLKMRFITVDDNGELIKAVTLHKPEFYQWGCDL